MRTVPTVQGRRLVVDRHVTTNMGVAVGISHEPRKDF